MQQQVNSLPLPQWQIIKLTSVGYETITDLLSSTPLELSQGKLTHFIIYYIYLLLPD